MSCEGKIKLVSDDRVRVDMGVHVGGQTMNCDLKGSMATPLGHYMVLGTANSMMAEGGPMTGGVPAAPGMVQGPRPDGARRWIQTAWRNSGRPRVEQGRSWNTCAR